MRTNGINKRRSKRRTGKEAKKEMKAAKIEKRKAETHREGRERCQISTRRARRVHLFVICSERLQPRGPDVFYTGFQSLPSM